MKEPHLAISELTGNVYIVSGKEKFDVTEQFKKFTLLHSEPTTTNTNTMPLPSSSEPKATCQERCDWPRCTLSGCVVNHATQEEIVSSKSAEGLDTAYPLTEVLRLLISATEILLYRKDYDGPEYEEMMQAVKSAKAMQEHSLNVAGDKTKMRSAIQEAIHVFDREGLEFAGFSAIRRLKESLEGQDVAGDSYNQALEDVVELSKKFYNSDMAEKIKNTLQTLKK